MTVVDTDVLIDAMRGEARASAALRAAVAGQGLLAVSAVTVMQLHEGIARSRATAAERDRVARALADVTVYAFTAAVAEEAGRILGESRGRGEPVALPDLMIGATALHHGEPVLTRNVRDFRRISGLEVVTP